MVLGGGERIRSTGAAPAIPRGTWLDIKPNVYASAVAGGEPYDPPLWHQGQTALRCTRVEVARSRACFSSNARDRAKTIDLAALETLREANRAI